MKKIEQRIVISIRSQLSPFSSLCLYIRGSYLGISGNTDDQGQASFDLADGDYKIRVDYLSGQYFSDIFSWLDTDVDINHSLIDLHVTFNQKNSSMLCIAVK